MTVSAQAVTKTSHKKAVKTDVVTTGTLTIRKPDYISISTDGGKDQLIMDGTRFTMTMGGRQHVTDSKKNPLFATFHTVLNLSLAERARSTSTKSGITTGIMIYPYFFPSNFRMTRPTAWIMSI